MKLPLDPRFLISPEKKLWNSRPTKFLKDYSHYLVNCKTALDIGAGYLKNSEYLQNLGIEVTALDIFPITHQTIHCVQSDIRDFNFPSKFDLITCIFTLHYMEYTEAVNVIAKISESLNPTGKFIIVNFNSFGLIEPQGYFYPSISDLRSHLQNLKFNILVHQVINGGTILKVEHARSFILCEKSS